MLKETKLVKSISRAGKLFQTLAILCDKKLSMRVLAMFHHNFVRTSSCNTIISNNNKVTIDI